MVSNGDKKAGSYAAHITTIDAIVPLKEEARYVDQLLESLRKQTRSLDAIHLIVAPSSDDTLARCREVARIDSRIQVHENAKGTAPHAMNIGLDASDADAWIRVDGHVAIPDTLIEILAEELQTREAACVGPTLVSAGNSLQQTGIGEAMSSPFGVGNAKFRQGGYSGPVDTLAFGLYFRSASDDAGRFNDVMTRNQDDEFNTRLRRSGGIIWLTDRVSVTYFPRETYKGLWSQYFDYGYWRMRGTIEFGNQLRPRQLVPVALVAAVSIAMPALASARLRPLAATGLVAYLIVPALQARRTMARGKGAAVAASAAAAAVTMHWGYGTGSAKYFGSHALLRMHE